jgi:hypothetical protein
MEGVIIDRVLGVGTTNGDTLGFVQCTFNDGDTRAIAFTPEIASIVASAFLTASGHLEQKQQLRRDNSEEVAMSRALPIADADVAVGTTPNNSAEIVLKLLTKAGAAVHVSLPSGVIRKMMAGFQNALDTLD